MNDYPQSAMSALGFSGLTSAFNPQTTAGYSLAHLQNIAFQPSIAGMQQAACARFMNMEGLRAYRPETRLIRAQRLAEEVRARHPEMQVKRLTKQEKP